MDIQICATSTKMSLRNRARKAGEQGPDTKQQLVGILLLTMCPTNKLPFKTSSYYKADVSSAGPGPT